VNQPYQCPDEQEAQAQAKCRDTALRNGFTTEQADTCDDGAVGCHDCPWAKRGER